MIRRINSKKGDLPVTLLVMGIFALCGFALLTFFVSDFKTSNAFVGVSVLQKINSQADAYLFYKIQKVSQDKLFKYFNETLEKDQGRLYFHEEKYDYAGNVLGFGGKKELVFSVKYLVPA